MTFAILQAEVGDFNSAKLIFTKYAWLYALNHHHVKINGVKGY